MAGGVWYRNTDNFHRWHDLTSCQVSDWPKSSLWAFHKHSRKSHMNFLANSVHQQMRYKDNLTEPYDHLLRKHSICPLLQMGKVRLRGKGGSGLKPYREEMTEPRWNPGFWSQEVSGTGEDADKPSLKEKRESVHVFRGLGASEDRISSRNSGRRLSLRGGVGNRSVCQTSCLNLE